MQVRIVDEGDQYTLEQAVEWGMEELQVFATESPQFLEILLKAMITKLTHLEVKL